MKTINLNLFLSFLLCSFIFMACGGKSNAEKAADSVDSEQTEDMIEAFNGKRENLQRYVQTATDNIEAKTQELRQKLETASYEEKEEIIKEINELEEMKQAFNKDMKKLGENIAKNWDEFKENNDWDEFSNGVEQRLEKIEAKLQEY